MDEKEIDLKIEKEMVDLFIISNRKERTLWELESPRKRSDGLSRFFFGTYLNPLFSVKISIPLENTGVSSVFATSVWPFSLIFSLARRNEGNFFQAVPTTLSSSLAEVRLASLVAWA